MYKTLKNKSNNYEQYIGHINQSHSTLPVLTEELELDNDNVEEFIISQTHRFVIRNSNKYGKKYICAKSLDNRAKSIKNMQREPKINKTKLGYTCPANITVKKGDTISTVEICNFHPHDPESYKTRLDVDVRTLIAEKLRLGIEKSKILAQVRNEKPGFLITSKDVSNIKAAYKIDDVSLNKNDNVSCSNIELNALHHKIYLEILYNSPVSYPASGSNIANQI